MQLAHSKQWNSVTALLVVLMTFFASCLAAAPKKPRKKPPGKSQAANNLDDVCPEAFSDETVSTPEPDAPTKEPTIGDVFSNRSQSVGIVSTSSHLESDNKGYGYSTPKNPLHISIDPLSPTSAQFHLNSYISDSVAMKWLKTATNFGFVSLLLPELTPENQNSDQARTAIVELLEWVKSLNQSVLYDADVSSASIVREIMGIHAIGITSKVENTPLWNSSTRVLRVLNPYMRLNAFQMPDVVTVSRGSAAGMATLVNGKTTHFTLMGSEVYGSDYFNKWKPSFSEPSLGFTIASPDKLRLRPRDFFASSSSFNLSEVLGDLSGYQNDEIRREANSYVSALTKMNLQNSQSASGAVIFGSSNAPGNYTDLVYKIAWKLARDGLPIATGGAGGVMEIANQGAYNAGGTSIGINLGGRLSTEKETASDVQTLSISVQKYELRIPLLLHSKRLVIFAPGGGGTLKELGAALLLCEKSNICPDFIFIGDYYQYLVKGLRGFLPPSIASKIHLASDGDKFDRIYNDLKLKWQSSGVEHLVRDANFAGAIRVDQSTYKSKYTYKPRYDDDFDDDYLRPRHYKKYDDNPSSSKTSDSPDKRTKNESTDNTRNKPKGFFGWIESFFE